jgi:hypothetical protein
MSSTKGQIIGAVITGIAAILAAIITVKPEIISVDSSPKDSKPVAQNHKPPMTDNQEREVASPVVKSSSENDNTVKINRAEIPARKENPSRETIVAINNKKQVQPPGTKQPVTPASLKNNATSIDMSGVWKFDVNIVKGKDTTGTLFDFHSTYQPIVELTQLGNEIKGTYSGPPAIMCGSGKISGSLNQNSDATDSEIAKVQWILNCDSECEGERRQFNGTYNKKTRLITGRFQPTDTPTRKGCWLAYEKLSGKPEF